MSDHDTADRDLLAQRYGRVPAGAPGARNGRGVLAGVITGVLLVTAVVGWMIVRSASGPDVDAELLSWDEPRDGVLTARVEIRRDADLALNCELIAVDLRRIIVGQLDLAVPAGPDEHLVVSADIPLEGDGIVPELRGCEPASE
ncbi:DUF4307 domain-containing protein [Jiangella alba]|uniref:DUF4307 domain-containing protein n=1 Tax=Jiangella alba TaxID=561176 RepID=A0A1H5PUJ6_9ACTN|nr:DUF4307 domain-containing protein [Jiangella alba]SEF17476.1 protein of unknown function [Jiangella alba]